MANNALQTLTSKLASRLDMGEDGGGLVETLKATAFREQVSDAQMTALLVVANQYGLNPWTKEIYAFPDKNNGIVPVVGVDGWSRIINSHPQFDGMDFRQSETLVTLEGAKPSPEWIECVMYRKDRAHPTVIREYLDEVYRPAFTGKKDGREYTINGPWQSHTKRFLRHKAMIQCSRVAFGFVGIYDQDEAERIVEEPIDITPKSEPKAQLPPYDQSKFDTNFPAWEQLIKSGKKSADQVIKSVSTVGILTEEMKAAIKRCEVIEGETEDDSFFEEYDKAQQGDDK